MSSFAIRTRTADGKRAAIIREWYGTSVPKVIATRYTVSVSHVSRIWHEAKAKGLLPKAGARDRQYFVEVRDGVVVVPVVLYLHVGEIGRLQKIADRAETSVMEEARAMLVDAISDREGQR